MSLKETFASAADNGTAGEKVVGKGSLVLDNGKLLMVEEETLLSSKKGEIFVKVVFYGFLSFILIRLLRKCRDYKNMTDDKTGLDILNYENENGSDSRQNLQDNHYDHDIPVQDDSTGNTDSADQGKRDSSEDIPNSYSLNPDDNPSGSVSDDSTQTTAADALAETIVGEYKVVRYVGFEDLLKHLEYPPYQRKLLLHMPIRLKVTHI